MALQLVSVFVMCTCVCVCVCVIVCAGLCLFLCMGLCTGLCVCMGLCPGCVCVYWIEQESVLYETHKGICKHENLVMHET